MTPKLGANAGFTNKGNVTIEGNLAVNGTITAGASATAATISHDLDMAAGYDIKCEAGDSVLDMVAGTGITRTTVGANTLGGDVTISGSKTFTTGTGAVTLKGNVSIDAAKKLTVNGPTILGFLAKTATYPITDTDPDIIVMGVCGAAATITLPTLADNLGRIITIILGATPGNNVVVDGEGAETINGVATLTNATQYSYLKLLAVTAEWLILARVGTWT